MSGHAKRVERLVAAYRGDTVIALTAAELQARTGIDRHLAAAVMDALALAGRATRCRVSARPAWRLGGTATEAATPDPLAEARSRAVEQLAAEVAELRQRAAERDAEVAELRERVAALEAREPVAAVVAPPPDQAVAIADLREALGRVHRELRELRETRKLAPRHGFAPDERAAIEQAVQAGRVRKVEAKLPRRPDEPVSDYLRRLES